MTVATHHRRRLVLALTLASATVSCTREPAVTAGSVLTARTLGLVYLQTDRLDSAEVQFRKVVAWAPDEALGYANLGLTYLRGGRLDEAEEQALHARKLDSTSTTIALLLARVHAAQDHPDAARAILEHLARLDDADPAVLYALAQLDTAAAGSAVRAGLLRRILARAPSNIAVHLARLDAFLSQDLADSATRALEEIRRLPPEPPREAIAEFARALPLLRAGRVADARVPLGRFRQAMELTSAYQASLATVRGPDGPMVGRPVLTFSPGFDIAQRAMSRRGRAVRDAVSFTDATAELGLAPAVGGAPPASDRTPPAGDAAAAMAVGDFDGDGAEDVLASRWDPTASAFTTRLFRAERGGFTDVTAVSKVVVPGGATFAIFADYDNDGHLDLYAIAADGRSHLFRNTGKARFEDVTRASRIDAAGGVIRALFVDLDHDGDLDVVTVGPPGVRALRNNADGTFADATADFGLGGSGDARDVAFADFDGDGRMDLFVSRKRGSNSLFRNAGARRFEDATAAGGLATAGGSGTVAVGDVNNDGALDLYVAPSDSGAPTIWLNDGHAAFTRDRRSNATLGALRGVGVTAAQFVDYDNDGWLDLVLAGAFRTGGARGVVLLRNDGTGRFDDRSALLPRTTVAGATVAGATVAGATASGATVATLDLGRDGDQDVIVNAPAAGLRVLRNDGGNANLFVQVRLAALRTGSGKNNDFGIGARVELRAGEVVQTRVVTGPITHFGLGAHLKADVLRVEWPNGVSQVIHFPGSDQDVLENEVLKSSCGFLYAWDGTRFRFVTDVMWRSALGMPLGIMGSNTAWAPAGASQEYLRIPGSALQPRDGRYVLQLTEELWETSYTDDIRLLAVDHPDSVDVYVDERFIPPGPIALRPYRAVRAHPPRSAVDGHGVDLLPALRARDDVYVSNLVPLQYQGLVETHDLVMDLGDDAGRADTHLFLRGWIYPTDASINVALSQQSRLKPMMPALEVRDASGAWRAVADIGFPSGKDKTVVVSLEGKFPTRDHHVRIRTNMQIYWDQAFVATDAAVSPVTVTTLSLLRADLHARGTSRMFRRGGRYGPHWFDYDSVTTEPVWRPITGDFTRFGDVLPLLRGSDDMYVVMAPGDETTLEFAGAPPPPKGWTRDFLLYSDGWIKDADMNTALGNTVGPLPFHAIRQYPYAPGERYPTDAAHQRYLREYNTRRVGRR
ncbi:MAG: FG-GAP-like repeat-containing protein [Gemmatimonadota bacterium]|mgnify:CR=1 FL=1